MKAIHPKFLNRKTEMFGLELRDVFICMATILGMKCLEINDFFVIGVPCGYLAMKFVLNLFFPRSHFIFMVRKKKYLEWSRKTKG